MACLAEKIALLLRQLDHRLEKKAEHSEQIFLSLPDNPEVLVNSNISKMKKQTAESARIFLILFSLI